MSPALPYEEELFNHPTEISGTVFVNDRVCVQTEEDQRVISVHGVVFSHYSVKDRAAEAYAMVLLFESGYADQNDIARCFGYSARSLRRYQERLRAGGLSALARPRGRPSGSPSGHKKTHKRDQTILRLKTKGMSNRWIAGRLGLSETAVRKSLGRLGWKSESDPEPDLPFLPEADSQARWATVSLSQLERHWNVAFESAINHYKSMRNMVEAGGVEPQSEKRYDTKPTCLAQFRLFRPPRSE